MIFQLCCEFGHSNAELTRRAETPIAKHFFAFLWGTEISVTDNGKQKNRMTKKKRKEETSKGNTFLTRATRSFDEVVCVTKFRRNFIWWRIYLTKCIEPGSWHKFTASSSLSSPLVFIYFHAIYDEKKKRETKFFGSTFRKWNKNIKLVHISRWKFFFCCCCVRHAIENNGVIKKLFVSPEKYYNSRHRTLSDTRPAHRKSESNFTMRERKWRKRQHRASLYLCALSARTKIQTTTNAKQCEKEFRFFMKMCSAFRWTIASNQTLFFFTMHEKSFPMRALCLPIRKNSKAKSTNWKM